MAAGDGKKRRTRLTQPQNRPSRADVSHDWEKDDEELELEEALFGKSKKRAKVNGAEPSLVVHGNGHEHDRDYMAEMHNEEVCSCNRSKGCSY